MKYKHLYRSREHKKIAGVCAGLAEYFVVDPVLVRLIFIIITLMSFGFAILAYPVMWFVIPAKPRDKDHAASQDTHKSSS